MARVFGNHSMAIDTWVTALDREALGKDDIDTVITRIQSTEEEAEEDSQEESPSLPSTTDGFIPAGESTARERRSL